jgi:hypothetical protein
LFASFPELIAGYHVFRRLSMPRHPPYTLSSLTTFIDHRRSFGFAPETPAMQILCQFAKKVLDDFCPKRANMHSSPDGKTKQTGQKSRRFILLINLEPRIHFSKSALAEKTSLRQTFPPNAGESAQKQTGRTDPSSTINRSPTAGFFIPSPLAAT